MENTQLLRYPHLSSLRRTGCTPHSSRYRRPCIWVFSTSLPGEWVLPGNGLLTCDAAGRAVLDDILNSDSERIPRKRVGAKRTSRHAGLRGASNLF